MIADIEFRWVKRQDVRSKTPTFADTFPMENVAVQALQFRYQYCLNVDELNRTYEWTDWQDVPVVEE